MIAQDAGRAVARQGLGAGGFSCKVRGQTAQSEGTLGRIWRAVAWIWDNNKIQLRIEAARATAGTEKNRLVPQVAGSLTQALKAWPWLDI